MFLSLPFIDIRIILFGAALSPGVSCRQLALLVEADVACRGAGAERVAGVAQTVTVARNPMVRLVDAGINDAGGNAFSGVTLFGVL